jgi:enterobactin synthetase component D / holo-[acyl-carrier protein] synthase
MLAAILPTDVAAEERFGEAPGGFLFPDEEHVVAHAVASRRREYAVVRGCARACLRRLGYPPVPILPGPGGAPVWPVGATGSMTHCPGYAAAAVGSTRRISSIGIDAEPDAPLPDGVLPVVATRAEQGRLAGTPVVPGGPSPDRLLFSAKEAVYKAWFPLVGEWLDAHDVEILLGAEPGTFTAVLSRDGLLVDGRQVRRLEGRWTRGRGLLLTAVVLPFVRSSLAPASP